jgi:hypothetical protein
VNSAQERADKSVVSGTNVMHKRLHVGLLREGGNGAFFRMGDGNARTPAVVVVCVGCREMESASTRAGTHNVGGEEGG